MMRRAGQRKSPRISAMEAWQARWSSPVAGPACVGPSHSHSHPQQLQHSISTTTTTDFIRKANDQGPAFWTRSRKKTKLKHVEQVEASSASLSVLSTPPTLEQWGKQLDPEVNQTASDQYSSFSSVPWLPEKRILELLLDILQRRDTYDIFGEPVDQNQVVDYYDIIEEPMDFGTMRAKLHEGMYRSLEEFEHDVFLIFNNAMHFNSSGTIYFRQARAINELAKKVLHILKTDPQNFESHFYETRRRISKRVQGDSKPYSVMKSSGHEDVGLSKTMPCSLQGPRSSKTLQGDFESNMHVTARDQEVKSDGRCRPIKVDKRWTYRPWMSTNDNESICSIYSNSNILEHVNQRNICYKESLMSFVKDLGRTAQIVAKKKLSGFQIPSIPNSDSWKTNTLISVTASESKYFSSQSTPDLTAFKSCCNRLVSGIASMGDRTYVDEEMCDETLKATLNNDQTNAHKALEGEIRGSNDISIPSTSGFNQVHQNRCSWLNSYKFGVPVRELNFPVSGFMETGNNPDEFKHPFSPSVRASNLSKLK